jgi:hypothetical protein
MNPMKKLLIIFAILSSLLSDAQGPPTATYTPVSSRYNWLGGYFRGLGIPVGCDTSTALLTGQWRGAGQIYWDSCAHRLYLWDQYFRLISAGSGSLTANGITTSGDTTILGDSIDRYTYIQVKSSFINNSPWSAIRLGNRPVAQSLNGIVPAHPLMLTYTPTPFSIEGLFGDQWGDIDSVFYGGRFSTICRVLRDSVNSLFGAGKRRERLAGGGGEFVFQYFPPRDTMDIVVGRDGQSGNTVTGQFDMGHSYGYNVNVIPDPTMPGFPLSNIRATNDLIRVIDNTRRKKMTGAGMSGFTSMYKSYQAAINMSTYPAANYWSKMVGYTAYGDVYPFISGATKAYTHTVAMVDTAAGFWAEPQYRYTNTVRNGFGYVALGDSDYNHFKGFVTIGGPLPTRQNLGQAFTRRLFVTGDIESSGNNYSFVSQAYGMSINIPIAIGTSADLNFTQKDSSLVGTVGAYLIPANRALRGMYIRSEIFNGATMDNNSTGAFVQIETGVNHAFATRWWRNGGMVVNRVSGVTDVYRLYKKFVLNGGALLSASAGDTVTIKNLITQTYDPATYKHLIVDALGNTYQMDLKALSEGTYVPTITNGSNVSSSSNISVRYRIQGSQVFVVGTISVTATASAANTVVSLSLPSAGASNFTASTDASGPVTEAGGLGGVCTADASGDLLVLTYTSGSTSARSISFSIAYDILP